jgi:predicted phosphodiesterase
MRYALISDIHSNYEALQAVLSDSREQRVDEYLCCGDIVGYGADPAVCLKTVRDLTTACVAGNHDWAVAGRLDAAYFINEGRIAVNMNRSWLGAEDIQYLAGLPLTYQSEDFILVHGTLNEPEYFHYLSDVAKAKTIFEIMEGQVCFVGHCHLPRIYIYHNNMAVLASSNEIEIKPGYKYLSDVGSVGQPRDRIPLAAYTVFDTSIGTIEIRRIPYDIETARKKIINAGLPRMLGDRLRRGY